MDDPEIVRDYYMRLVRSETDRIQQLLERKCQEQQPVDQIAEILGELAARISVIERAAEQELLVESPLLRGPLLYGNLDIIASDIKADGFHSPEPANKNQLLRWTKCPDLLFQLPAWRAQEKILRIYFKSIIKPEYRRKLKIFVDKREVKHMIKITGSELCLECRLPPAENLALTNVHLKLPGVHSPAELGVNDDPRVLGIAITRVSLGTFKSSIFSRPFSQIISWVAGLYPR